MRELDPENYGALWMDLGNPCNEDDEASEYFVIFLKT